MHDTADHRAGFSQMVALFVGLIVLTFVQFGQGWGPVRLGFAGLFLQMGPDTVLVGFALLLLPVFWYQRPGRAGRGEASLNARCSIPVACLFSLLVALTSLGTSHWISRMPVGTDGVAFGSLPPALHDEYSYLFQSHTFQAGALAFDSHPRVPQLFDQMHVLNEGRFASRYFPLTGVWMSPFAKRGEPIWGHWLAGALCCVCAYWIGRELAGDRVGLLAGLFAAVSPGIGLFGNLLLAHQPTMLFTTLFIYAMTVFQRRPRWLPALAAGATLALAMLGRPLTAAGIGLPYGIWLLQWACRRGPAGQAVAAPRRWLLLGLVGLPVVLGLGFIVAYNQATTRDPWCTPYQLYTDTYTPRHVYGFDNVVRGEQRLGPKVIDDYDRWAANLTPRMAARNVYNRLLASWRWTFGLLPLVMAIPVFALRTRLSETRWWLIMAAILTLHLAHIPYWYDGIMHWHYVFETAPLWCLVLARAVCVVMHDWRVTRRLAMKYWLALFCLAALIPQYFAWPPLWRTSRMEAEVNNLAFSRLRYAQFERMLQPVHERVAQTGRQALVLIEGRHDVHIDFVTNTPPLTGDVLRGRFDRAQTSLEDVVAAFPDRDIYLFNSDRWQLQRL